MANSIRRFGFLLSGTIIVLALFGASSSLAQPKPAFAKAAPCSTNGTNCPTGGGGSTGSQASCASNQPSLITCNQINNVNKSPDVNIVNKIGIQLINFILYIGGALAIIFIIIGGLRYIISAGDPGQIASAKATIQYAITGLLVIITAVVIVNVITKLNF